VTGIYLSDVPVDQAMHGSLFVTAHFHYTLMGAGLVGAIAGLSYWFPKMTGKMLNEKWATIGFWTSQVGFQVTFLAMFAIGMAGLPRRDGDYPPQYATGNMVASIGAYVIMLGMLIYLGALITSWVSGETAPPNPWGGKTLEWHVPNPIPLENFEVTPVVTSDFYTYGEAGEGPQPDAPPREDPELVPEPAPAGGPPPGGPPPGEHVPVGAETKEAVQ
jgi:cytochrome c oxidase subunit 1